MYRKLICTCFVLAAATSGCSIKVPTIGQSHNMTDENTLNKQIEDVCHLFENAEQAIETYKQTRLPKDSERVDSIIAEIPKRWDAMMETYRHSDACNQETIERLREDGNDSVSRLHHYKCRLDDKFRLGGAGYVPGMRDVPNQISQYMRRILTQLSRDGFVPGYKKNPDFIPPGTIPSIEHPVEPDSLLGQAITISDLHDEAAELITSYKRTKSQADADKFDEVVSTIAEKWQKLITDYSKIDEETMMKHCEKQGGQPLSKKKILEDLKAESKVDLLDLHQVFSMLKKGIDPYDVTRNRSPHSYRSPQRSAQDRRSGLVSYFRDFYEAEPESKEVGPQP